MIGLEYQAIAQFSFFLIDKSINCSCVFPKSVELRRRLDKMNENIRMAVASAEKLWVDVTFLKEKRDSLVAKCK